MKADFAGPQFVHLHHFRRDHANPLDRIFHVRAHHADGHALFQNAVDDPHQNDHAEIGIIPAIDQQGFQRCVMHRPLSAAAIV